MSLYNNFIEESKAHELWEKIGIMFQNKNVVNRVSVFWKLVRLKYQDGSNMAEHMNAFQGLINRATSIEVRLVDEVLALLLLCSLLDSCQMLDVTLGYDRPEGKQLSLARVKASLLRWRGMSERQWSDLRLQSLDYQIRRTTRKGSAPKSLEPVSWRKLAEGWNRR